MVAGAWSIIKKRGSAKAYRIRQDSPLIRLTIAVSANISVSLGRLTAVSFVLSRPRHCVGVTDNFIFLSITKNIRNVKNFRHYPKGGEVWLYCLFFRLASLGFVFPKSDLSIEALGLRKKGVTENLLLEKLASFRFFRFAASSQSHGEIGFDWLCFL